MKQAPRHNSVSGARIKKFRRLSILSWFIAVRGLEANLLINMKLSKTTSNCLNTDQFVIHMSRIQSRRASTTMVPSMAPQAG